MTNRRARTLRARAVLRARREGFLTPEARLEASLPVHYGAPNRFQASHIRLTPSDGGDAVVVTADMVVTILPRIRMYPRCPRAIGAWIDVHVVFGEPFAAFDAVSTLRGARTVRVEAWAYLAVLRRDTWSHLAVPDVHGITWGPENVDVGHEGFQFDLLNGHTDAEWRLELRTDDPANSVRASVAS